MSSYVPEATVPSVTLVGPAAVDRAQDVTAENLVDAALFALKAKRAKLDAGADTAAVATAIMNEHKAAWAYGKMETGAIMQAINKLTTDFDELTAHVNKHLDELAANVNKLSDNVDGLRDNVDELSDNVNKLSDNVDGLSDTVRMGLQQQQLHHAAQQSTAFNSRVRAQHAHAVRSDDQLLPLKKESLVGQQAVGAEPDPSSYPATVDELRSLTDAQVDVLAEFYAEDFGAGLSIDERRNRVAFFLGVGF